MDRIGLVHRCGKQGAHNEVWMSVSFSRFWIVKQHTFPEGISKMFPSTPSREISDFTLKIQSKR